MNITGCSAAGGVMTSSKRVAILDFKPKLEIIKKEEIENV